jgi:hypothetical protein
VDSKKFPGLAPGHHNSAAALIPGKVKDLFLILQDRAENRGLVISCYRRMKVSRSSSYNNYGLILSSGTNPCWSLITWLEFKFRLTLVKLHGEDQRSPGNFSNRLFEDLRPFHYQALLIFILSFNPFFHI